MNENCFRYRCKVNRISVYQEYYYYHYVIVYVTQYQYYQFFSFLLLLFLILYNSLYVSCNSFIYDFYCIYLLYMKFSFS